MAHFVSHIQVVVYFLVLSETDQEIVDFVHNLVDYLMNLLTAEVIKFRLDICFHLAIYAL